MTTNVTVPVLIAGAGSVGITPAMDLARLGVDNIVLEARREVPPNPRCNTTNARSMELLRRLGCADAVRSAGLPPDHNTDIAEGLEPSARSAALLEALAQPVKPVISADARCSSDRRLVRHRRREESTVTSPGGRFHRCVTALRLGDRKRSGHRPGRGRVGRSDAGQHVARIDQGGNVVAFVPIEPVPISDRPLRCVSSDDVLVIAASGSFWRVDLRD